MDDENYNYSKIITLTRDDLSKRCIKSHISEINIHSFRLGMPIIHRAAMIFFIDGDYYIELKNRYR